MCLKPDCALSHRKHIEQKGRAQGDAVPSFFSCSCDTMKCKDLTTDHSSKGQLLTGEESVRQELKVASGTTSGITKQRWMDACL